MNIIEEDKVANKIIIANDSSNDDLNIIEERILNQDYGLFPECLMTIDICKGIRPEIMGGTSSMPEYAELMKRRWNDDPKKRPTAKELKMIYEKWVDTVNSKRITMKKIVHIPENELKIKYHPNSCYTSRKIKYSAKLNEYLSQDSLSDKIVIMNYDNTEMNEYFENATTNDFSKILAIGRVDSRIALKARNKYELFEWTPYTPYTQ
ncbi:uncharacterized protein OCT59_027042 [Rhizophagus irregularis]|uniref:Serine-threonine/tyrosine-protein kinase catalytic domain-containing protein n=1 Tax=Rhizophagus irregularis (strain DAOM 181602 / DAOM 197198 / MUCL 43194) TaxID=747089 RepID=U9SKU5_RHIID|nr:hypothetical protein GLOIN_2v1484813 [Rhizophagus irregularis DAOM 181602=DAOM 197198]POG63255.1 hypothetical protein GLOIN_2v1484813 [Rhizophagus irregularis DAOM 181602=DAOM 197198]UZO06732.1 hypothetical protein OCT59_027042 [Rhizophagus irregularis]|eukprot:XP_025170121.1 hypothetical protein GLOIN_2v1484813 [Rhizophagus irregularis DAOM 181602=DAOM 197198]